MKRSAVLVAVVATLWLVAGAASAATVTISADAPVVFVGDTITLTVNTDSQGELVYDAYAQVNYDPALVSPLSVTQVVAPGFLSANPALTDQPGWKTAFDQITAFGTDPGTAISSTLMFLAVAPGVATFTLGSHSGSPLFAFASAAPGNSVSVTIVAVPEPATATLLCVGLLHLAATRRRQEGSR
jgi:hypothetical protein